MSVMAIPKALLIERLTAFAAELAAARQKHRTKADWRGFADWNRRLEGLLRAEFKRQWPFEQFRGLTFEPPPRYHLDPHLGASRAKHDPTEAAAAFARAADEVSLLLKNMIEHADDLISNASRSNNKIQSPASVTIHAHTIDGSAIQIGNGKNHIKGAKIAMATLDEKKASRWRYLKTAYELLDGRASPANVSEDEIARVSGLDEAQADEAGEYLKNERLIEYTSFGPHIGLTHYGIKEYERATSHPERPTQYFPPIINIQNLTNSQVQIGSHGSSQVQNITQGLDGTALANLVKEIRCAELPSATRQQLDGILHALEQQKQPTVVRALLGSAKAIVDGAGGALLAAKIAAFIGGMPGV